MVPIAQSPDRESICGDGRDRGPEELTKDYLQALRKHLMYVLEQKLGSGILKSTPIDFVLTVPAIWSDKAKERTLNACRMAGIVSSSDTMLSSEPVSNLYKPPR